MSGMSILTPLTVTDAMLSSCTVTEPDSTGTEIAWVTGTTYALKDRRYYLHKIYERVVAGAGAITPDLDTTNWAYVKPTNRWSSLDNVIGTSTTAATSPLTYVFVPGQGIGGVYFAELLGKSVTVSMKDRPGGNTVYNTTVNLDGSLISSIYDWLFVEYLQKTDTVLTDLPSQWPACELTVTVASTTAVACGVIKFGYLLAVGVTTYGAKVGILSYGKKTKDAYGNYSFLDRGYARKGDFSVVISKADFNKIFRLLSGYSVTPAVYIGSDVGGLEPLIVYGVFQDFYIVVDNFLTQTCTLQIEGLI